jgi:SAM-dependent methyltransferase
MATVAEHYDSVLADVYAWMAGGFDAALARNADFFARLGITPRGSRRAVDLGAGCGFQSIPLAARGFDVTAIDLDRKLLEQLRRHPGAAGIAVVQDDLLNFAGHVPGELELAVCMVDTILHLPSRADVTALFERVHRALQPGGKLIVTFRDLTGELTELERFIPVRSDSDTVFTCFLEYEPETVKVHDLVYRRSGDAWSFHKSFYRKLRLAAGWVVSELERAGFGPVEKESAGGSVTVIASR